MNNGILLSNYSSPLMPLELFGGLAVLNETFPTRPAFFPEDIVLLLHFNERNNSIIFNDSSLYFRQITRNDGAIISTAQSRFGGSSLYTDGNIDALQLPTSPSLDFGTGPFTIEWWMRSDGTQDAYSTLFSRFTNAPNAGGIGQLEIGNNRIDLVVNRICFVGFQSYSSANYLISTSNPNDGLWHHIACVREANRAWLFFDGRLEASVSNWPSSAPCSFSGGRIAKTQFNTATDNNYRGWLDEIRVTKAAIYKSPFIIPNNPFPNP